MKRILNHIPKFVPVQKEMSTILGGTKTLLQEITFYISILNLIMITRLFYYSTSDPWIRMIFPHYLVFMAIIAVAAVACMTFEYAIMIPSKVRFSQEQAYKADRSPIMREVKELKKQLDYIQKKIEEK